MPTVRNPPLRTSLETRHIRRTASAIEAAQSRAAQWGQATPFCVLFTRPPAPRNVEICCYSDCSCVPCGGEALASAPCFAFPKQSGAGFRTLLEGSRLGDFLRPLGPACSLTNERLHIRLSPMTPESNTKTKSDHSEGSITPAEGATFSRNCSV